LRHILYGYDTTRRTDIGSFQLYALFSFNTLFPIDVVSLWPVLSLLVTTWSLGSQEL